MNRRNFIMKAAAGASVLGSLPLSGSLQENTEIRKKSGFSRYEGTGQTMKIAVVQQDGNPGQVEINRNKALAFARDALAQKADVILFHEELLIGYDKNLRELAEPVDGVTTRAFQELLKGTDSLIIYGLTEKDGNDYFISAPVVSADRILANYRKTHLWWKAEGLRHEPTFYKPGDKLVTFNHKGYLCGIMICYDGDFPEMTRSYANLGCSVVFWLNNRGSRGYREVRGLAAGNSMIIAASCCCGKNEMGKPCPGGSNITGAGGELITEIWDKEGIIIADVNPAQIENLRKNNPLYTGLRPELYHYK